MELKLEATNLITLACVRSLTSVPLLHTQGGSGSSGSPSTDEVKAAFKIQAMLLHPDKFASAPENEKKQVNGAAPELSGRTALLHQLLALSFSMFLAHLLSMFTVGSTTFLSLC